MRDIVDYFDDPEVVMSNGDLASGNMDNTIYAQRVYTQLAGYINYLTELIVKSKKLRIDIIKLANLILEGEIEGISSDWEKEYLVIFLDSLYGDKEYDSYFNRNISKGLNLNCESTRRKLIDYFDF
jgi:hypothetical protein